MTDLLQRGIALIRDVENEKAITILLKALGIDPKNSEIFQHLGLAYFNIGDYENALKNWTEALNLNPHHHQTWWALGNLYETINQLKKAKEAYQKAVQSATTSNPEKAKRYQEWVKRIKID